MFKHPLLPCCLGCWRLSFSDLSSCFLLKLIFNPVYNVYWEIIHPGSLLLHVLYLLDISARSKLPRTINFFFGSADS